MGSSILLPCLKWLEWGQLQPMSCVLCRGSGGCHPSAAAPLCLVPAVLSGGCVLVFLLGLSISSIPKLFMPSAAKTIRCAAIQEICVIAP